MQNSVPYLRSWLLRSICALVLLIVLGAGLWPFRAPRNEVSWMSGGRGLLFGKHGSIVSASPFRIIALQGEASCTLQILLEPKSPYATGMILAFYSPEDRAVSFSLRQWRRGIVLESSGQIRPAGRSEIYLDNVFAKPGPVLVTVASSTRGTSAYADDTLITNVPDFVISSSKLSGQLIVGGAPRDAINWSGGVMGLAIYGRDLSADEVSQTVFDFTNRSHMNLLTFPSREAVARYLFREGKGNVVRDQLDSAPDLVIPERFFVLNKWLLELPWDEFRWGWYYWKNVLINILGFVPLGFFFCSYFSRGRYSARSAALTIAFGFTISLIIEILQFFLPTRDSGMTDLITNTLGTAIGVIGFKRGTTNAWTGHAKAV